jgi:hypothetical protein
MVRSISWILGLTFACCLAFACQPVSPQPIPAGQSQGAATPAPTATPTAVPTGGNIKFGMWVDTGASGSPGTGGINALYGYNSIDTYAALAGHQFAYATHYHSPNANFPSTSCTNIGTDPRYGSCESYDYGTYLLPLDPGYTAPNTNYSPRIPVLATSSSSDCQATVGQLLHGNAGPLTAPAAFTPTTATTGGNIPANTYYVVDTYTNSAGETTISPQASITTTGTTSTITVPTPISQGDASGFNVYIGTVSGGPYFQQGVVSGGSIAPFTLGAPGVVTTFVANNSGGNNPQPPGSNSSAGSWGNQGTNGTGYIDTLAQQFFTQYENLGSVSNPNHIGIYWRVCYELNHGVNANQLPAYAQQFITAWQFLVTETRAQLTRAGCGSTYPTCTQAKVVSFLFNPTADDSNGVDFRNFWPGNNYVDVLSADGYDNNGTGIAQRFQKLYGQYVAAETGQPGCKNLVPNEPGGPCIDPTKPFFIAETAASNTQDQSYVLADVCPAGQSYPQCATQKQLKSNFPQMALPGGGLAYFNHQGQAPWNILGCTAIVSNPPNNPCAQQAINNVPVFAAWQYSTN